MWSPFRFRPLLYGFELFISGLALGAALASRALTPARADIHEAAILMNVLPESVMSLSYATPRGMITAQRSAPGAPFQVQSTFADGRPVQRCSASADLGGVLTAWPP